MDVHGIVKEYLEENGFDGLYSEECACLKDDLMDCGGPCYNCEPGYRNPCDCGEHDWHIGPNKHKNKQGQPSPYSQP